MSERGVFPADSPRSFNDHAASRWRWRCSDQQAVSSRPVCVFVVVGGGVICIPVACVTGDKPQDV